jgi:hypothetical protein
VKDFCLFEVRGTYPQAPPHPDRFDLATLYELVGERSPHLKVSCTSLTVYKRSIDTLPISLRYELYYIMFFTLRNNKY